MEKKIQNISILELKTKYEIDGDENDIYDFEYCYDELGRLKESRKRNNK